MKSVAIVRNRGQLTIPDAIRKAVKWISPMSAVSITVAKSDEIVIKPHVKSINKDQIWESVRKARAIKGKGHTISALEFIIKDRQSH